MREDAANIVKLETKGGGGGGQVIDLGSIVRLRSGGPEMTVMVVWDYEDGLYGAAHKRGLHVQCSWFCGDVMRTETFPPSALTVVG
jgi:uncharacterized protein YodC (DUF2158 family)